MHPRSFSQFFGALSVVAILLIAGGAYFFIHTSAESSLSLAPLNSNASSFFDFEVLYTDQGFIPDQIEVPLGARVAFKNNTTLPLETASDPHPTHTDYPEFDAGREYAFGETYIFEFERTGTFGYHNHNRSIDRGIVRVIDPTNPVPNIDKTIPEQRAIRDTLLAMFDAHDPNSIFTIVDAIQSNPALSLNCHDIAHDIGHRAYELFGFSEAMTFSNPNHVKHALVQYICAGGYMHGIVEELSLHQPTFKTHPDPICEAVPASDRASCFHGVGHALMFANSRDVSTSLDDCRGIEQSTDTHRCFEGVWMELFWGNTEHTGPDALGWDLDKPLAPCTATQADAKPACFIYSTFGYLRTHVKDYAGAVTMCTQSDLDETDTEFCLKGLGITMMSKFKGQHLEGSEIYVNGLAAEKKQAFYEGVMGYARLSGISEVELQNSCNLFKTDADICTAVLRDSK